MLVMMYGSVTIEETLIPEGTSIQIQKRLTFGTGGKREYFLSVKKEISNYISMPYA